MNLLIIPQVMHIIADNYDIIIREPCWVEWCADDPASGSPYAARSLLIKRGKNRPEMEEETIAIVRDRLLQSPKKSIRRLSQETRYSYSKCQRAAKKANLRPYKITCFQELADFDKDKQVRYSLWFREFVHDNPRILDITWFSDETWFHLRICKRTKFRDLDVWRHTWDCWITNTPTKGGRTLSTPVLITAHNPR